VGGKYQTHVFRGVSSHAFLAVSALLFAVSAAVTIVWCGVHSADGGGDYARRWYDVDGSGCALPTDVDRRPASFLGMGGLLMVAI